jgi:HEPN domain-containing protein
MPQRQLIYRYPTPEVQGEDSYVKIRAPKVRDIKALRKVLSQSVEEQLEAQTELIRKHVVEWNWVDDEGNQLPLPSDDLTVLDELTSQEQRLLGELIGGKGQRDTQKK